MRHGLRVEQSVRHRRKYSSRSCHAARATKNVIDRTRSMIMLHSTHRNAKTPMATLTPRILPAVASCVAALLSGTAAAADTSETDRLLDVLVQKHILTEEELRAIRAEVATERESAKQRLPATDLSYEPMAPVRDDKPSIQTFPFSVQSSDGKDIFRIRGRVQLDA